MLLIWKSLQFRYSVKCSWQSTLLIKSLPNDEILDWSKLKPFADDKIKILKMMIFVFDRVENIVGKRRKYWLPAFSPLPSMFPKGFLLRHVKSRDCVVKS